MVIPWHHTFYQHLFQKMANHLSSRVWGGWTNPSRKICNRQIGFIFPKVWGELERTLKPPPSCSLVFCDVSSLKKKLTGHLSPPVLGQQILEIWKHRFRGIWQENRSSNEVGTWLPTVLWRCGLNVGKPQDLWGYIFFCIVHFLSRANRPFLKRSTFPAVVKKINNFNKLST